MARESTGNRSRLVAAWIFVAVAAIVVVAVIPPVWTDRYPRATPGRAVAALFVSAVCMCSWALGCLPSSGGGVILRVSCNSGPWGFWPWPSAFCCWMPARRTHLARTPAPGCLLPRLHCSRVLEVISLLGSWLSLGSSCGTKSRV